VPRLCVCIKWTENTTTQNTLVQAVQVGGPLWGPTGTQTVTCKTIRKSV